MIYLQANCLRYNISMSVTIIKLILKIKKLEEVYRSLICGNSTTFVIFLSTLLRCKNMMVFFTSTLTYLKFSFLIKRLGTALYTRKQFAL